MDRNKMSQMWLVVISTYILQEWRGWLVMNTTDVVSSNPEQTEVYNIMWQSLSVTSDRSMVFSVSSSFLHQYNWPHDITEILLNVALSTIKPKPKAYINKIHCIKYCSYVLFKLSLDNNCFCSLFLLQLQKMIKQHILHSVHFLVQLL